MQTRELTLPQQNRAARTAFPETLRRLRDNKEMSQKDLADRIGRSISLISLLESGRRIPTITLIGILSNALGLNAEEEQLLLESAGYKTDPLNAAVSSLISHLESTYQLSPNDREIVAQDIGAVVTSWDQFFQSRRYLFAGQFEAARDAFDEIKKHNEYTPTLRTFARKYLADAWLELGEFGKARQYINKALVAITRLPKDWARGLQAEVYATKGIMALRAGRYLDAEEYIKKSIAIYNEYLRMPGASEALIHEGLGRSYKRLAQVAMFAGEPMPALSHCLEAETHLLATPPTPARATFLRRIKELRAWAYSKNGEFSRAVALYEEALRECERVQETAGVTKNQLYLGDAYRREIQDLLITHGWHKALEPGERRKIIQNVFQNPANIELLRKAEEYYRAALDGLRGERSRLLLGRCLLCLGILLRIRGSLAAQPDQEKYREAQTLLNEALQLEHLIGSGRRLPNVYEALAELTWEWEQDGWRELTLRYYRDALEGLTTPLITTKDPSAQRLRKRVQMALDLLQTYKPSGETPQVLMNISEVTSALPSSFSTETAWRDLCAELITRVYKFIVIDHIDHQIRPTETTPYSERWAEIMAHFEQKPGPRFMAQNELSSSLSLNLPPGYPATAARYHIDRYYAFRQNLQSPLAANGTLAATPVRVKSRDLCCRKTLAEGLHTKDADRRILNQMEEALGLLDSWPAAYELEAGIYEIPLSFEIKGLEALLEIPYPLADRFTLDHRNGVMQTAICYQIDDSIEGGATFVRDLAGLFEQLLREAQRIIGVQERLSTKDWLREEILQKMVAGTAGTGSRF